MKSLIFLATSIALISLLGCKKDEDNPNAKTKLLDHITSTLYNETIYFAYNSSNQLIQYEDTDDSSHIIITGNQLQLVVVRQRDLFAVHVRIVALVVERQHRHLVKLGKWIVNLRLMDNVGERRAARYHQAGQQRSEQQLSRNRAHRLAENSASNGKTDRREITPSALSAKSAQLMQSFSSGMSPKPHRDSCGKLPLGAVPIAKSRAVGVIVTRWC